MKGKSLELHLPSELGWERAALDFAARVARKMGFSSERIDDLTSALNEAIINAIEHGNGFDARKRVLILLVPRKDRLSVTVQDHAARPFPRTVGTRDRSSIDEAIAGRAPARGWGAFLIRALVDEAEFSSTDRGNGVEMTMYLRRAMVPRPTEPG
jgi:serine/threonine-protein kinase RsbW